MRADEVAHYLDATKSLSGQPVWIAGSKDNQFRLKWPVIFRGTGGTHVEITYSSGAPYLKYSIMLMIPPPVFRLDVGSELTHMNLKPRMHSIQGSHFHPAQAGAACCRATRCRYPYPKVARAGPADKTRVPGPTVDHRTPSGTCR